MLLIKLYLACFDCEKVKGLEAICHVSSDIEETFKIVSELIKSKSVTINYEKVTSNNKEWQELETHLNKEGVHLQINKVVSLAV